jgi:hypothetical protein
MEEFMRRISAIVSLAGLLLAAAPAAASGTIRGGDGGFDAIAGGAWDLTFIDATFLSRYEILDDGSAHSLSFFGGPGLRYFLFKNFSIHLTPGFTYDLTTTDDGDASLSESSWSLLPFLGVDYYLRLPGNFFLKPGLSAGYYWGNKETPVDENTSTESTISGFAGRVQLALIYYAGPNLNLRAGLDLVLRFGSSDPESGDSVTNTLINTGFTIGIGYTF